MAACPAASGPGIIRQRALPTADGGMTPLLFAIPMVTATWSAFDPWMNLSHAPYQNASNTTPKATRKMPVQRSPETDSENQLCKKSLEHHAGCRDGNGKAQVRNPGQA